MRVIEKGNREESLLLNKKSVAELSGYTFFF